MGEDDRQPVMALLAVRWSVFKVETSATVTKENHPGESISENGPKKNFVQNR